MINLAHKGRAGGHLEESPFVRAEVAVMKTVIWGGLVVFAVGAAVFDVGRWFGVW